MCGIIGGVAERDVVPILLAGLKRLEYRGYDSAGAAVITEAHEIMRERTAGKVIDLKKLASDKALGGHVGIAHTRWATHGKPETNNAHPHVCKKSVAVVHNGIIENYELLRKEQTSKGYDFTSETDTEVIAHQIYFHMDSGLGLLEAVKAAVEELEGAYALGVIAKDAPDELVVAREGSPLVIGVGIGEYFVASEAAALLPVTQRFIYLEEGDVARITRDTLTVYDKNNNIVKREIKETELTAESVEKGTYKHYMLKEIYEQPQAIANTLQGAMVGNHVLPEAFGYKAPEVFKKINTIRILACGTSYHAGLVASYWFESLGNIPCRVEIASEFRYRDPIVTEGELIITISQSGETADTIAALKEAKKRAAVHTLAICNVPESALTRESDLVFLTRAGPEIGVASTKAFTTQLTAFLLLVAAIGRCRGMSESWEEGLVKQLKHLPSAVEHTLSLDKQIKKLSENFSDKHNALFLGRGTQFPIALEGALKLKEISYIHAEAYPAGELKHGPLALVDVDMPVIAVAPNNELLEKLKSNLEEVKARGGELYIFADEQTNISEQEGVVGVNVAATDDIIAPIIFTIPLQLLSYHVAVLKGTDVDQPRNLAKSVTVE